MYEQLAPPSVSYTLGVVIYLNVVRTGHLSVGVIQRQKWSSTQTAKRAVLKTDRA